MSYLRMIYIESDMKDIFKELRWLYGVSAYKSLLETPAWIMEFPGLQVSEEGHFLAGAGTLGCSGKLEKKRIHPNL